MNIATALQFDSITFPAWTEPVIRHTRRAAAQSQIILKAFSKTIAPVIAITAKDLGHYYILCGQGAGEWAMNAAGITHNPIQAAARAAYAELTSPESITTYRRIRTITRETAIDGLIIGLCGVVAVSVGIEQAQKGYVLAQKGYRATQKLYGKVSARLNPSEPQPELLPSCEMALASTELAAALDKFADVAEAEVQAKADADVEVQYSLEAMKQPVKFEPIPDFWTEALPLIHTLPVVGPVWNPAPRDIHTEIARLMALQYVPFTLAPAPASEQKLARKSRSSTPLTNPEKANPQPHQTKAQRKPRAKAKAGGQ